MNTFLDTRTNYEAALKVHVNPSHFRGRSIPLGPNVRPEVAKGLAIQT